MVFWVIGCFIYLTPLCLSGEDLPATLCMHKLLSQRLYLFLNDCPGIGNWWVQARPDPAKARVFQTDRRNLDAKRLSMSPSGSEINHKFGCLNTVFIVFAKGGDYGPTRQSCAPRPRSVP
jgi:hypothetical protein